jgi:hypothetical protein
MAAQPPLWAFDIRRNYGTMDSMKTNLIPAVSILLNRAEGPSRECGEKTFTGPDCWQQAHRQLRNWSYSAPKGGGYDKTDFTVTFADGNEYEGRFDLSRDWDQDAPSIEAHIHNHCTYHAGLHKSERQDEDGYRRYLALPRIAEMKAGMESILRNYDLNGMPHLTDAGLVAQWTA